MKELMKKITVDELRKLLAEDETEEMTSAIYGSIVETSWGRGEVVDTNGCTGEVKVEFEDGEEDWLNNARIWGVVPVFESDVCDNDYAWVAPEGSDLESFLYSCDDEVSFWEFRIWDTLDGIVIMHDACGEDYHFRCLTERFRRWQEKIKRREAMKAAGVI